MTCGEMLVKPGKPARVAKVGEAGEVGEMGEIGECVCECGEGEDGSGAYKARTCAGDECV